MPHTRDTIRAHMKHVASQPHATAKKTALFDVIQGMIKESLSEQAALGVTAAQQKPFHDTIAHFDAIKAEVIATDLS